MSKVVELRRWLACVCSGVVVAAHGAVPGGVEVLTLPDDALGAYYRNKPVLVTPGSPLRAVVGVPLSASIGAHFVEVAKRDGTREKLGFEVVPKDYPEQHLKLANPKMVNPDPADLARIERETALMRAQYELFSQLRSSPFPLLQPVEARVSSQFGLRRVLNGEPRSPHTGLDLAAPEGTPVLTPADGVVALTGEFYFNGNTVFVDHGGGLISMVCHLSAIDVTDGAQVTRGQRIGRVGSTGRATAAHLHWSLSLNGERVDPAQVLELSFSESTRAADVNAAPAAVK